MSVCIHVNMWICIYIFLYIYIYIYIVCVRVSYMNMYVCACGPTFSSNKACAIACAPCYRYGVATMSRPLKIICLFCRISSLLYASFAKETCIFKEPTNRSHPIYMYVFIHRPRRVCGYDQQAPSNYRSLLQSIVSLIGLF